METSELIRHLATGAAPVRRLPPPWPRTAMWLAISLPYVCAIVVMKPAAIDFLGKIDVSLCLGAGGHSGDRVHRGDAAFASVIPGHHQKSTCYPWYRWLCGSPVWGGMR